MRRRGGGLWIGSVLPTSPGRTTCRSSMKNTETRAGVEELVDLRLARALGRRRETVRAGGADAVGLVADQRRRTFAPWRSGCGSTEQRAGRVPDHLRRRFSVNALEPVACRRMP